MGRYLAIIFLILAVPIPAASAFSQTSISEETATSAAVHSSQREEEISLRDLRAQEEMARWSGPMLSAALASSVIAGLAFLVSAMGLYLLYRTLLYTRQALEHTESGAAAAWEAVEETRSATAASIEAAGQATVANDIARQGALDHDRPYMLVIDGGNNVAAWRNGDISSEWKFSFKNFGRSPALLQSLEYSLTEGREPELQLWHSLRIPEASPIGRTENFILAPEESTREFLAFGSRLFEIGRFEEGETYLWLRIRMVYEDFHGRKHYTACCFRQQYDHYKAIEFGGREFNIRT